MCFPENNQVFFKHTVATNFHLAFARTPGNSRFPICLCMADGVPLFSIFWLYTADFGMVTLLCDPVICGFASRLWRRWSAFDFQSHAIPLHIKLGTKSKNYIHKLKIIWKCFKYSHIQIWDMLIDYFPNVLPPNPIVFDDCNIVTLFLTYPSRTTAPSRSHRGEMGIFYDEPRTNMQVNPIEMWVFFKERPQWR